MDIARQHEYIELTNKLIKLSEDYYEARMKASEAKLSLDYMLASKYEEIRTIKSNVGIESAYVILMELEPTTKKFYQDMTHYTNKYKGLEKIMDAMRTKVSLWQSLCKWEKENT